MRPRARTDEIVVEELGDETLVYDKRRHRAHCLNRTAAAVWRACDGRRAPDELAVQVARELGAPVDESLIALALTQLAQAQLLIDAPAAATRTPSRRQAMRALVLAPAVLSILVPRAAQAASCLRNGSLCLTNAQCCSGRCGGRPGRCLG
jgi:hypothetical protein